MMSSRGTPRISSVKMAPSPARSLPAVQCQKTARSRGTVSRSMNFAYWAAVRSLVAKILYWPAIYSLDLSGRNMRREMTSRSDSSSREMPSVSDSTAGRWWYSTPGNWRSGCLPTSSGVRKSTMTETISSIWRASASTRSTRWPPRIRRPGRMVRPSAARMPPRSRMLCSFSNVSRVLLTDWLISTPS